MKVYELAKELEVKSKVIVDLLNENSDQKFAATTVLTDEQIEFVRLDFETIKNEEEKKKEEKKVKRDVDYKPDEMIPCHSVFPGVLHFTGRHTGMTYKFVGPGDRRNVEYQDLKAGLLEHAYSIFDPDIIIEDDNLINDEHWWEVKEVYENMYSEEDIKKVLALPTRDFESAFVQLPNVARNTIITIIATQIDNGTFEQYNKAKIIDKICGTRFDLKM